MRPGKHRILHVGGSTADAQRIREALAQLNLNSGVFDIEWVPTLASGLDRLATGRVERGVARFPVARLPWPPRVGDTAAGRRRPHPVVAADEDDEIGQQATAAGADDYLLISRIDGYWLPRALARAIERRLSEDALFSETERVEVTLNSLGDGLLSTDNSGRVNYLNKSAEAMTGWARAEASGRPLGEVLQIVDSTTREPAADPIAAAVPVDLVPTFVSNSILIGGMDRNAVSSTRRRRFTIAAGS